MKTPTLFLILILAACRERTFHAGEVSEAVPPAPADTGFPRLRFDSFYGAVGNCRIPEEGKVSLIGEFIVEATKPAAIADSKMEMKYGLQRIVDGRVEIEWKDDVVPFYRHGDIWRARTVERVLTSGGNDRLERFLFAIKITHRDGKVEWKRGSAHPKGYFHSEKFPERGRSCAGLQPLNVEPVAP